MALAQTEAHLEVMSSPVHWNAAALTCLLVIYGCACAPVAECDGDLRPHMPTLLTMWPLQKLSTVPWFRLMLGKEGEERASLWD